MVSFSSCDSDQYQMYCGFEVELIKLKSWLPPIQGYETNVTTFYKTYLEYNLPYVVYPSILLHLQVFHMWLPMFLKNKSKEKNLSLESKDGQRQGTM